MKERWTRLQHMVLSQGGNTKFMEARFKNLFERHHKNACEIVYNKDHDIIAAVYFTPIGIQQKDIRSFMKFLRDEIQLSRDQEE